MNICIVGAGPSGICAAKEIKEQNPKHKITIIEKTRNVGGRFSCSYSSLTLVNNPLLIGFSDFLPESALGEMRMWSAEEYSSYLKEYAREHGVLECIQFDRTVKSARYENGKWDIIVVTPDDKEYSLGFDFLVVCSSSSGVGLCPTFSNQDSFRGKIIHSGDIKGPDDFSGLDVVLVGLGETASDLSYLSSQSARSTTVSVRRWPGYFIPRYHDGIPTDLDTSKIYHSLSRSADSGFSSHIIKLKRKLERHYICSSLDKRIQSEADALNNRWERVRHLGPFRRVTTKSCGFLRSYISGKVKLKSDILEVSDKQVHFSDGTSTPADLIVCCTGYKQNYDFLSEEIRQKIPSSNKLYKYMFLPGSEDHLAFIGYIRPAVGTVPPLAELQARLLAHTIRGDISLPPVEEMRISIEEQIKFAQKQFPVDFPRLGHIIDYYSYMHSLAELIGVMPKQLPLLLRNPRAWYKVNFSFLCPGIFRLHGPGAKPGNVTPIIERLPTMPKSILFLEVLSYLPFLLRSLLRRR